LEPQFVAGALALVQPEIRIARAHDRWHQPTIDYIARRREDGKTSREASRCLKRYLARNLYRLLEHPPMST
jgi:transposase